MSNTSGFATRVQKGEGMGSRRTAPQSQRVPSQVRSKATLAVVLEAAAQILVEHGYAAATTNRIAARAGVSIGTLYQYFRNKDDVFDRLVAEEADAYLAALLAQMPDSGLPIEAAVRQLLAAAYPHHRLITSVRYVMRHLPDTVYARRSSEIRQRIHDLVVEFLAARAPFPGISDLSIAADVIIAMCEGLTFLGRVDRSVEELVAVLAAPITRYLECKSE